MSTRISYTLSCTLRLAHSKQTQTYFMAIYRNTHILSDLLSLFVLTGWLSSGGEIIATSQSTS